MTQNSFRKHLSMPGMLSEVRKCLDNVPDLVVSRGLTLSDCLMTGLAMFSLKMTSMLSFDEKIRLDESSVPAQNFKSLFGVDRIPSDTRVRERLDDVDPRSMRPAFKNIWLNSQIGWADPQLQQRDRIQVMISAGHSAIPSQIIPKVFA